jgi:hypothetical protein
MTPLASSPLDGHMRAVLTIEERRLVYQHCHEHPVAHCSECDMDYKLSQVGRHFFGPPSDVCPACSGSLVGSILSHISSCAVLQGR